ncbi:MAG: family transcriptional regulator, cyclic receptor protein [Thermoleophilaceae bacterium]|jgi:CRP-like cAMP-binding protein|nr:family transcriptional regulator, cyclic receptor protein [Thermoleophilaceae bacterium]
MDEARLKNIPLFANLSRKERRALAQRADEVDLAEGRQIVREGEFPYEFFALEEGTAEVRRGDQFLAELGPGDFFGEMGLVSDARRNATVIATSPVTAVVMTGQAFRQTARELPEVADKIRAAVEERARQLESVS